DLDTTFENVRLVNQPHLAVSAPKKLYKHLLEILVDGVERLDKFLARSAFDLGDRGLCVGDRLLDVRLLCDQEIEPFLDFGQLVQSHHVDWAKSVNLFPKFVKLGLRGVQVKIVRYLPECNLDFVIALFTLRLFAVTRV